MKRFCSACSLLAVGLVVSGCNTKPSETTISTSATPTSNRVILYTSVDDVYARKIVAALEKRTGLDIEPLYDVEAAKTAGLANRIRAEKARPRGDVFWSSALLQTLLLKRDGLLQPHVSSSAYDVPQAFKDSEGYWTGMGTRARVLVWHQGFKGSASRLSDL